MAIGSNPQIEAINKRKKDAAAAAKSKPIVNPIVRGYSKVEDKNATTRRPLVDKIDPKLITGGAHQSSGGGQDLHPTVKKGQKTQSTTYKFQKFDRYKANDKDGSKINAKVAQKSGVLKDVHDLKKIKGAAARRAYRTKHKLYLGKYYGPDQFKGDEKLNKAWQKAGRPNANSFARSYKK